VNNEKLIAPLAKALARSGVRILAIVAAAYTVIAAVTLLWGGEETLAWTMKVSMLLFFVAFPLVVLTRIRFGRALRNSDPLLADRLGLFGRLEWDGAKNLAAINALIGFLWRRDYRNMQDPVLRRLAAWYACAYGFGMMFASAMIASVLVIVSIALGLLPEP